MIINEIYGGQTFLKPKQIQQRRINIIKNHNNKSIKME